MTLFDLPSVVDRACPWKRHHLGVLLLALDGYRRVLDPFGGEGTLKKLNSWGHDVVAFDIEPERARQCGLRADANRPPFAAVFDAVACSPAFGNRWADSYDGRDGSKRHTYVTRLGHPLDLRDIGRLQWGEEYRAESTSAWQAIDGVIRPGGRLVFHMKDHPRDGKIIPVTAFHLGVLDELGWTKVRRWRLRASSVPGAGHDQVAGVEYIIALQRCG